jgi:hypothetical protein
MPLLLRHRDLREVPGYHGRPGDADRDPSHNPCGDGYYCISLNKSWPVVYAEVEQVFTQPPGGIASDTYEAEDLNAARIETGRHAVCQKVDWMTSGRWRRASGVSGICQDQAS